MTIVSDKSNLHLLNKQIAKHIDLYYEGGNEQTRKKEGISDSSFDILFNKLEEIDPKSPLITKVGAELPQQEEWKQATHKIPMGSLNKVYNRAEVEKWVNEYFDETDVLFVAEKLDGLSIECVYENGQLTDAITRGNGLIGYSIVSNVRKMRGVKHQINDFTGSLRGEILLKKSDHLKYFSEYDNVRNAAVGITKRLDGDGCEHLTILFYQCVGNFKFKSEIEQLQFLQKSVGLETPNFTVFDGNNQFKIDALVKYWEKSEAQRQGLDYDIDGLVIKLDDLVKQIAAGQINLRPRGAKAFKFHAEAASSIVNNITVQTGSKGRLTPVAEVEPVILAGAEISRATLHNFKNIQELGINIGAQVIVSRRGDVIPYVEGVLENTGSTFETPLQCPACNGPVEFQGEYLVCINTDTCPAQIEGRILNWIEILNLLEWGETLIHRLVEQDFVNDISDLYKLNVKQLAGIERMGDKSAQKCLDILWKESTLPLTTLIGGLSIPLVAVSTMKLVVKAGFDSLEKLHAASYYDFLSIKGFGERKAKSLFEGLKRNKALIEELLGVGLKIEKANVSTSKNLQGMVICITGSTNIKRSELAKMIERNGGIWLKNMNSTCTHLIAANDDSTSEKMQKAKAAGVKIITENNLLSIINKC